MSQEGKVALVTGGAQGIGRAFVESLLQEGASVAILDVNPSRGQETANELSEKYPGKVAFFQCDVTNHQQFEDCFKSTLEKFSRLDIVVNNAGIGVESGDNWTKLIDINFKAVVRGSKLGVKYMGRNHGGSGGTIVNIASITAVMVFPALPVYAATKAAVNHFTRSYGDDTYYKVTGVRLIAIAPGLTDTPLAANSIPGGVEADPLARDSWDFFTRNTHLQNVKTLGRGLIELLKKAESGSLWTIDNDEPPVPTVVQ